MNREPAIEIEVSKHQCKSGANDRACPFVRRVCMWGTSIPHFSPANLLPSHLCVLSCRLFVGLLCFCSFVCSQCSCVHSVYVFALFMCLQCLCVRAACHSTTWHSVCSTWSSCSTWTCSSLNSGMCTCTLSGFSVCTSTWTGFFYTCNRSFPPASGCFYLAKHSSPAVLICLHVTSSLMRHSLSVKLSVDWM